MDAQGLTPPALGTIERWAWDYVLATELEHKLRPPSPPDAFEEGAISRRIVAPGRPRQLVVVERAPKAPKGGALREPRRRAEIFHTFLHHELQAAELFAWALLAFPDTPSAFRMGLIRLCLDEVRHMNMYLTHMRRLGVDFGDFPVRDWFWRRVPGAPTPASFVAVMGLGLEAANLDHAMRFTARLREVGDEEAARIEEQVGREEVPHVRFGVTWFKHFVGVLDYPSWVAQLPPPLSPWVLRGDPMNDADRLRAGMDEALLDGIRAYREAPAPPAR